MPSAGNHFRRLLVLTLAIPLTTLALGAVSAGLVPADGAVSRSLVRQLQSGGYLVYVRHAETDRSQVDQDRDDLTDCMTQRNLSEAGREQARAIGAAMRNLNIPVGKVIASPYCRARDTARLAFEKFELSADLRFGLAVDVEETTRMAKALRKMLSTQPAKGTNTILVSHSANLKEATGIWPQPEGAAYIFKPLPDNGFEFLGSIAPDAWARLESGPSVSTYTLK